MEIFNQTTVSVQGDGGGGQNFVDGKMTFCKDVDSVLPTSSLLVAQGSFLSKEQAHCQDRRGLELPQLSPCLHQPRTHPENILHTSNVLTRCSSSWPSVLPGYHQSQQNKVNVTRNP